MNLFCRIVEILNKKEKEQIDQNELRLILTEKCVEQITKSLQHTLKRKHEGIVYLFGRTDGQVSLAISAYQPRAKTTPGSVEVSESAMIPCVQLACKYGLQIVGQVHTHPEDAYHSAGDDEGAYIRYSGFASLVIPDYGKSLPSLRNSACYMWQDSYWIELHKSDVIIVQDEQSS